MSKRIICVGPCGNVYKGGIAQFFSALVSQLSKENKVSFFTWKRMYPAFLIKRNFKDQLSQKKVSDISGEGLLDFYNPFSFVKLFFEIRKREADYIILNWAHPVHAIHYIFLLILVCLFLKTKTYLLCHNVKPHENFPGATLLTRIVFNLSDYIIVHSGQEAEKARSLVKTKDKILTLFMPLFDFVAARSTELKKNTPPQNNLLFFGIIRKYKGVDLLIKAFDLVKNDLPDLKLTIAGENFYQDDASETNLEELINKLNLNGRINLINRYIANEEIPDIFAKADAAVFPFRSVTQSASLTLAFAHGLPVIVSDLPAFSSLIEEGKTGVFFKPESVEDLAAAIKRFYEYPDLSENIADLSQQLTWEKYAKLLVERKDFKLTT